MTKIFNLSEAKDQLSSLVDRAASGEEIVIAKHGKPLPSWCQFPPRKRPAQAVGRHEDQVDIA